MDEASQRGRLASEELNSVTGDVVPVANVRIQEVAGAAHHVSHATLLDELERRTGAGFSMVNVTYRITQSTPYGLNPDSPVPCSKGQMT